ncbi:tetratricopeptide repeat (TPR)-like superfamily protein [Actinidia rufa]|uniref:Tetratricopeptide repeat (TPR)-like superfamily protein n=1 Tax=Actinidia rufa TaxID=165716 RepID=A0A7J0GJ31_9ERIC|nr:tetratricopeptide repeat (TPR)-like superfamily protein [Actinidia rufa]
MPERNLVTWNSVINGFALNGRPNEALTLYREMGLDGVEPDGFTMVSLLTACAELGALALGRRTHVYMEKVGLRENAHAANALLDLYAKCGSIREAKKVFDEMGERSVVSWNCLVVGLAVNGFGNEALEVFKDLERERLVPTGISFIGNITVAWLTCWGRAGLVKRAYEYIQNMSLQPNAIIWRTLLGACTMHGHLALGEVARAQLLQLDPKHSGDYVLLSNLYASERRWTDVQNVRRTMLKDGVKKTPGFSLVELGNRVYEFVMGDRSNPQGADIYAMLGEIKTKLKLEGYVPHTSNVLVDIEDEEKETALAYHSEKIAVAFMLINTPSGTPIRVVKNLRKVLPALDGALLCKCETVPKKIQCAFCHSTEDCEASGDMVHHLNGIPVSADYNGGSKVIHAHRNCTEWGSTGMFMRTVVAKASTSLCKVDCRMPLRIPFTVQQPEVAVKHAGSARQRWISSGSCGKLGLRLCMMAMKPVDEQLYEIGLDVHGIRDGPRIGRSRVLNKRYLHDLIIVAGGTILQRKPIPSNQESIPFGNPTSSTFIIYSLESPDKCDPNTTNLIFSQRRLDAEALASSTEAIAASNSWVLNSIAACKLQYLPK